MAYSYAFWKIVKPGNLPPKPLVSNHFYKFRIDFEYIRGNLKETEFY